MSRLVEITVSVDLDELSGLNRSQCHAYLGKVVGEQHEGGLALPPTKDALLTARYASKREAIEAAFRDWAALHDGRAPTRRDWSVEKDPDHQWPRAASVAETAEGIAARMGIQTFRDRRSRCKNRACHCWDGGAGCEVERTGTIGAWTFAVEVLGGLPVRSGGDHHATRSQMDQFRRNRQMVTAGAFVAPDVVHLDRALAGAVR